MRRLSALLAFIACAAIMASCGGSTRTVTRPTPGAIPASRIHVPIESAIRPDGYQPQAPPSAFSLSGSQIHLSHAGARFIEGFEGFGSCPYWDAYGGVWTRGYGETEGISGGSACISRSFGERNLIYRAERFYGWAIKAMHTSFNQNQVDALFSFAWNLGAGIFRGSLRYSIERHNPYPLLAYDHAGGQVLSGLARRRRAEVALFLRPAHEETAAQRAARLHRERTQRLRRDYSARQSLRRVIAGRRCSHGYRGFSRDHKRKCTIWRTKGAEVNRDIKRLRRLGIR